MKMVASITFTALVLSIVTVEPEKGDGIQNSKHHNGAFTSEWRGMARGQCKQKGRREGKGSEKPLRANIEVLEEKLSRCVFFLSK